MRQRALVQAVVALVCAFATCIPCKTVFASEQVGSGAMDVTVTRIVSNDEPAKDEPTNGEPAKEDPENSGNPGSVSESENNGSNKSQADPSEDNSRDKKDATTPEALSDARRVASENAWAVAPVSDNNNTNNNTGDNSSTQASAQSIAKTGDDSLAGTAAVTGCVGVGIGTIALIMRARHNRDESK